MSRSNSDENLLFSMFIGFLIGLLLAVLVENLHFCLDGVNLKNDDKICVLGKKYRVINIDDSERFNNKAFDLKLNVNKL